ncbi:Uncharacterized membrane protein YdjX, TVP38/TMEM64 family, SNARE-associated domain [Thermosyntropha lipolytica DSM 11003]|uniref:TVP38/TMEM64 family membrane protein n=1 Tax=Thermosyntropha lipolytica DSM 11003 TaxID=1123382 RepID=A0A1M5REX8_9FIRM|nr:VTT domain-containing protein [Thermosyntropha lipolytica]SHH24895.1 Uncharacterized membrane protein YdjX, TVP38/TMEM64 family, SNARE-associated domain [Thermosyntropha lipolytica DSM 11003]
MHDLNFYLQLVQNYGYLGIIAVLIFIIIQCHVPVMPFAVLAGVCGFWFGFAEGVFLSWISVVLGCLLAFYVYRFFRLNRLTAKLLARYNIKTQLKDKLLISFIIISHNIPFIPIAVVNIVAAVSEIKVSKFLGATALGLLIPSILFSGLGAGIGAFVNHPRLLTLLPLLVVIMTIIFYKKVDWEKRFYRIQE